MCIEFVLQVIKQKNAHVSFPVGMVSFLVRKGPLASYAPSMLCLFPQGRPLCQASVEAPAVQRVGAWKESMPHNTTGITYVLLRAWSQGCLRDGAISHARPAPTNEAAEGV